MYAGRVARAWWLVAGLLIAAFLARGPLYLSVFPPFEGWDEYQHLAYIVHLDETGAIPVFNKSNVSAALRPLIAAMPHSQWGAEQVQEWGALSYAEYWNAPAPTVGADRQRIPRCIKRSNRRSPTSWPCPSGARWAKHIRWSAIYAIRAMNLLLVAAALVLFAAALERLVPAFAPRVAVFALVCLHPLFFQNVARVANDALAVATGMAGISLLVLADGRTLLTRGLLAAVCLAASVWAKQTSLTLIPAFVLGLPLIGWAHGVIRRPAVACDEHRGHRVSPSRCAVVAVELPALWGDPHDAGHDRTRGKGLGRRRADRPRLKPSPGGR